MVDPIGTCQALDLLTQDQLEQLFDESNGYLSKVDEIFDTVQIKEMQQNEKEHNFSTDNDAPKQRHRTRRRSSIITDKKCLILDVDNTLIYVRHFMDEMRVGDTVKLGDREALVTKITYRLDLEFSENPGQMSAYDHVLTNKEDQIPQRGEWFPDELSKVAIIHQADPTGCVIKLIEDENNAENNDDDNDTDNDNEQNNDNDDENKNDQSDETNKNDEITISFLQNSDELSMLEPMMNRLNYLHVTFMYGGYLVRIRPGLGEFLARCNQKYDVILFTAADGSVYQGLLKQVHHILKQELDENKNDINYIVPQQLWSQIYFRADCDEKYDEYGLPYRHKNLAKLGRELSTIVMVDDNPLSYRGFEPNSVRVAGFWGLSEPPDNELMKTLFPTLWTIADHSDVRYHLSGLQQPPPDENKNNALINNTTNKPNTTTTNDNKTDDNDTDTGNGNNDVDDGEDLLTRQRRHSRQASAKFLNILKEAILAENESEEESSTENEDDEQEQNGNNHNTLNVNGHIDNAEETADEDSDDGSADGSVSVDSISADKVEEIERRNTIEQQEKQQINQNTKDEYDNFVDVQDVVNKYTSMPKRDSESTNNSVTQEEHSQQTQPDTNDGNGNGNNKSLKNNNSNVSFVKNDNGSPHDRNLSESGIGTSGVLIFDNYDEDTLFRDAYDSPKNTPKADMLQKRPSVELELNLNVTQETKARASNPSSPNDDNENENKNNLNPTEHHQTESRDSYNADDDDEDEEDEEDEDDSDDNNKADFVYSTPVGTQENLSISTSSNRKVDTTLLNNEQIDYGDGNKDNVTDGFISIEMNHMNHMNKTRPSRSPTPIDDIDAAILIEKTSGCSCFGWFGKKKKNKNVGLAQQELR